MVKVSEELKIAKEQTKEFRWHFWLSGASAACALMVGEHQYSLEFVWSRGNNLRAGAARAPVDMKEDEAKVIVEALRTFRAGEKLPVELLGIPVGQ